MEWCRKKTFTLQSHLCKQHWNLASMCMYCGQLFMFKEDLDNHQQRHNLSEFRCFQCGRKKHSSVHLRNHVYNHFVYERYGCNICEKRFKKKKNIEKHLRVIHFNCQYCGNNSDSFADLKKHEKIHRDLKCVLCEKVFSGKNRLKYHYQLQHGHQDFYKCSICFQRFVMKSRYLDHLKLKHNGVSNFDCTLCKTPFLYWQSYVNHFEKVHAKPILEDKYKCLFCDFKTELKIKLKWHIEKTSGYGFFCKKCQLGLECKGIFEKHMQTHVGENVWTCDYCPRSYDSDNVLMYHISVAHREVMIAHNPKGYPCIIKNCDRYYKMKSSLKRHIRLSHGESDCNTTSNCGFERSDVCQNSLIRRLKTISKNRKKKMNLKRRLDILPDDLSNDNCDNINIIEINVYNCEICKRFWFRNDSDFISHMSTHKNTIWEGNCTDCNMRLESPKEAVRHYVEDHWKVEFVQ